MKRIECKLSEDDGDFVFTLPDGAIKHLIFDGLRLFAVMKQETEGKTVNTPTA